MASYRRRGSRPRRPTYAESRHPQWVHEFKGYLRLTNVLGLQILEGQIPRPVLDAGEHAPQLQRTFTASSEHYTSTLLMDEHASDEDEDEIDELVDKLDRAFLDQTITGPDLQVLPTSPSGGDGGGGAAQPEGKADAGAAQAADQQPAADGKSADGRPVLPQPRVSPVKAAADAEAQRQQDTIASLRQSTKDAFTDTIALLRRSRRSKKHTKWLPR